MDSDTSGKSVPLVVRHLPNLTRTCIPNDQFYFERDNKEMPISLFGSSAYCDTRKDEKLDSRYLFTMLQVSRLPVLLQALLSQQKHTHTHTHTLCETRTAVDRVRVRSANAKNVVKPGFCESCKK